MLKLFSHCHYLYIFQKLREILEESEALSPAKIKEILGEGLPSKSKTPALQSSTSGSDVVDAASGDSAPPNSKKCVFKNLRPLMHHFERVFRVFYTNIIANYELSLEPKHLAQDSRIHLMYLLIVLIGRSFIRLFPILNLKFVYFIQFDDKK